MFSIFRKKPKLSTPKRLVFKTNNGAFEHACEFLMNDYLPDHAYLAIVERNAGKGKDCAQSVVIKIANDRGGQIMASRVYDPNVPTLKSGDLVLWACIRYVHEYPLLSLGKVIYRVKAEFDLETETWVIDD